MLRKLLAVTFFLSLSASMAMAADTTRKETNLTAAEVVARNVAARGGLQAWRSVQEMTFQGKMGAGGNQRAAVPSAPTPDHKKVAQMPSDPRPAQEVQLPFKMELQRSRKQRIEIQFRGDTAIQIFDGTNGWKLRPYLNRREVEPFTKDEMEKASMMQDLDGPLVDYAAKGTTIALDGMEKVEGSDTYKLKLTMSNGKVMHIWIDATTFLEAKADGQPRHLDGADHLVEVYYRDYRTVDGLKIPFVLETKVVSIPVPKGSREKEISYPSEQMVMEKVVVNAKLDPSDFAKPQVQMASIAH